MGGLILLLALSVVMALASFLAGALPLSMTLSQSQLRFISSLGVGILVGTSLIVIIPEGIAAVSITGITSHTHGTRHIRGLEGGYVDMVGGAHHVARISAITYSYDRSIYQRATDTHDANHDGDSGNILLEQPKEGDRPGHSSDHEEDELPTFFIGLSLTAGFVLMFLIDRLPRHATETLQSVPATRHISLDNLESSTMRDDDDDESEGFLGSLTPTPRQSRSLATTIGLVIHAAADGIAMGASATTEDMKLGFIIFFAIMIHKAPAAFGLTSVLLRQGLSKRAARGHLIVFSLAAPVGALATYLIISIMGGGGMEGEHGQWWTGMLLLFSAGTFLYVAMHAMQEENTPPGHEHHSGHSSSNGYSESGVAAQKKQAKPQMRDTLATVVGMLLPLLTQFGHHH